jgi:hypothetical protein
MLRVIPVVTSVELGAKVTATGPGEGTLKKKCIPTVITTSRRTSSQTWLRPTCIRNLLFYRIHYRPVESKVIASMSPYQALGEV